MYLWPISLRTTPLLFCHLIRLSVFQEVSLLKILYAFLFFMTHAVKIIKHHNSPLPSFLSRFKKKKTHHYYFVWQKNTCYPYFKCVWLNAAAKCLTLLLCIQNFLDYNFGPETGCPDWGCSWLSSVSPENCSDNIFNCITTSCFNILFNLLFANHPIIQCCIVWNWRHCWINHHMLFVQYA